VREIKFRIWRKDPEIMTLNFGFATISHGALDYIRNQCKSGSVVIMQYTGLKDKNGKEIYEGDILETPTPYGIEKILIDDIRDIYYEEREGWGDIKLMTIIGNIYENPELLGGSK